MKKLFILFYLLLGSYVMAQYGHRDSNRIGISGGLTYMDLYSKQLNASPAMGWAAGFSLRGNFYNDWQLVYGMQFTESNFGLESITNEEINFKFSGVQVYLVGSYVIKQNTLSLEIGPVLQVNGKLNIEDKDELKLLKDTPLVTAKEITDITKINGNLYLGFTVGITNLRFQASYQHGLNNILNNLNKDDVLTLKNNNERFKGNLGMFTGLLTIYL